MRLEFYETVWNIEQEVARLNHTKDTLLSNIKREATKEADISCKAMLDRTEAKALTADAQQEAEQILRDARANAAKLVADGEDRLKGIEEGMVLAKAKALLAAKAAA
jgi:hypothetical protein